MNRLRKYTFLFFIIMGLTGLLGCNKVATKMTAATLTETMSDHTYQAVYTSLDAKLIFADGETLFTEKNGQKAIYENGELTENSEDDVIAMIRWQGNFYYLREQNDTAFLETPTGMQITLEKDPRGYDPNHIRAQFIFSEKAQYLRYGYQLYLLNGEMATQVAPDIRWVGGGMIADAVYAIGYVADKTQAEGGGYTALYQIDQEQVTLVSTLTDGAAVVCGGKECLYILANDKVYQFKKNQLVCLTQLLPLGLASNKIIGMTTAEDNLYLLTESGYYVLFECEDSEAEPQEGSTEKAVLRVGYYNDETGSIQEILAEFATENPKITFMTETYASYDELLIKMISGDVPDVLWFNGELATFQMLAGKGMLQDLSGIAAELNGSDEYYWNILSCGTLGDELVVMFPAFAVEIFSAPSMIIPESYKIKSCQQFDELFLPYCPDGYGWTTQDIVLNWFLNDSLSDFVNYETKEVNFQQSSFYEILEFCKKFPAKFEDATSGQSFRTVSLRNPSGIVSEEDHYARFSSFDTGVSFSPLPFSHYAGFGVNADSYLAVTQACRDEESAKALVQFIFRADTQEKIAQQEYGKIVLHKKTNEKLWENADESDEWKSACETLQSILQRVDHLNGCYDDSVIEIIAEESSTYFQADASVQDVAARIDQRVAVYLMEQG